MSASTTQPTDPFHGIESPVARRLLVAALDAFSTYGYHATTTREIGRRAGLSPAGAYVHYASKADLLYEICIAGHQAVLRDVQTAVAAAAGPVDRLRAFSEAFATWHARNHTLARVIQYELSALDADRLAEVVAIRQKFSRIVSRELRDGVGAKLFSVEDVSGTTLAILSLGIDIARWYDKRRRRSPESVGKLYGDLTARMVDAS